MFHMPIFHLEITALCAVEMKIGGDNTVSWMYLFMIWQYFCLLVRVMKDWVCDDHDVISHETLTLQCIKNRTRIFLHYFCVLRQMLHLQWSIWVWGISNMEGKVLKQHTYTWYKCRKSSPWLIQDLKLYPTRCNLHRDFMRTLPVGNP